MLFLKKNEDFTVITPNLNGKLKKAICESEVKREI